MTHYLALIHHEDAVGKVHYLIELERDQKHGVARVPLLDQPSVNAFDRADVETARGLNRNEELGPLVHLAGDDRLLLVAAGHAPCGGYGALTRADVELLDKLVRIFADRL